MGNIVLTQKSKNVLTLEKVYKHKSENRLKENNDIIPSIGINKFLEICCSTVQKNTFNKFNTHFDQND